MEKEEKFYWHVLVPATVFWTIVTFVMFCIIVQTAGQDVVNPENSKENSESYINIKYGN